MTVGRTTTVQLGIKAAAGGAPAVLWSAAPAVVIDITAPA